MTDLPSFPEFNKGLHGRDVCPVCHTAKNVETVLVPKPGTERDGIVEAGQVHKKCYELLLEMSSDT